MNKLIVAVIFENRKYTNLYKAGKNLMHQYADLYFTTATILNWQPLLFDDKSKDVIIDAFRFSVKEKRSKIWAFVIMDNHFHLVWQILPPYELKQVRQGLLKYTAQKLIANLIDTENFKTLELYRVDRGDRTFQIWERNPLSISLLNDKVLNQKIDYIHNNLLKKGRDDVNYKYSSAKFYATGERNWDFL